jgi:hypothetical protein
MNQPRFKQLVTIKKAKTGYALAFLKYPDVSCVLQSR